jgi:hypothetical protein
MPSYRRLALRLLTAGCLIALLGVVGLVAGLGEKTTRVAAGHDTSAANGKGDDRAEESPLTFVHALAKAARDGDVDFRFDRLHPAVIERYGADACRSALDDPADPTARFEDAEVDHVGPWDYTSDGETTTIKKATFVNAERYEGGQPGEPVVLHLAAVDDDYRWFTDCTD